MFWMVLGLAAAAPFARVAEDGDAIALELATRHYVHEDGTDVALVGVAHVAEGSFFEAVGGQLAEADVVLFEGVGGGPTEDSGEGGLNGAYVALADGLGLVFQHDALDYSGENWRNSDLTLEELAAAGGDDDLADLLNGGREVRKMEKLATKAGKSKMVRAMTRVMLVESLPRSEAMMEIALGPSMYETVVVKRNERVQSDLGECRGQKVAVLYGAGHLRELEERLLGEGFTPGDEVWTVAITADPETEEVPPAVVGMVRKKVGKKLDKMERKARR